MAKKNDFLAKLDAWHKSDAGKAWSDGIRKLEDAPAEQSGEGWSGSISGFCPVQGEGMVLGRPWYFRARHDSWRLEVDEKVIAHGDCDGDFDGSWMPFSEAWKLIRLHLDAYAKGVA